MASKRIAVGVALSLSALSILGGCRGCSKSEASEAGAQATSSGASSAKPSGLSAPIAAAHTTDGEVLVAGFDASEKGIRVMRIDAKDRVGDSHLAVGDASATPDSELKLHAHVGGGAFLVWRGSRGARLVRQILRLDEKLAPKGEPSEIPVASCATQDGVWVSDGTHAVGRTWSGATSTIALPKDEDSGILCGPTRAYALLDQDDALSVLPLLPGAAKPIEALREKDFGGDEQRDVGEYMVGGDIGFVRIASSGALAIRELDGDKLSPLHKLKTAIGKDDDIQAIDASPELVTIVLTRDASSSCSAPTSGGDTPVASDVVALRVRRDTFEESVVELAKGKCGTEVGPFFSSALGKSLSVAWTERAGGAGKARAPIVGLVHATISASGPVTAQRIEQAADALVDAGCSDAHCYAAALVRQDPTDPTSTGSIKILRY